MLLLVSKTDRLSTGLSSFKFGTSFQFNRGHVGFLLLLSEIMITLHTAELGIHLHSLLSLKFIHKHLLQGTHFLLPSLDLGLTSRQFA